MFFITKTRISMEKYFQGHPTGTDSANWGSINRQAVLHRKVIHQHWLSRPRILPVVGNIAEHHRHQVPQLLPAWLEILRIIFLLGIFMVKLHFQPIVGHSHYLLLEIDETLRCIILRHRCGTDFSRRGLPFHHKFPLFHGAKILIARICCCLWVRGFE